MTDWWAFVSRYMALRKMNSTQVAERAGFNKSRMTDWSDGKAVSPKLARDTAKALNAPVLDAFVAAGYLEPEDTNAEVIEKPASSLSDDELLIAIDNRVKGLRNALEAATQSTTPTEVDEEKEVSDDAESGLPLALEGPPPGDEGSASAYRPEE